MSENIPERSPQELVAEFREVVGLALANQGPVRGHNTGEMPYIYFATGPNNIPPNLRGVHFLGRLASHEPPRDHVISLQSNRSATSLERVYAQPSPLMGNSSRITTSREITDPKDLAIALKLATSPQIFRSMLGQFAELSSEEVAHHDKRLEAERAAVGRIQDQSRARSRAAYLAGAARRKRRGARYGL